jgi:hypothetical protein
MRTWVQGRQTLLLRKKNRSGLRAELENRMSYTRALSLCLKQKILVGSLREAHRNENDHSLIYSSDVPAVYNREP